MTDAYWNKGDEEFINYKYDTARGVSYFKKYKAQLNHTFRARFSTMYTALTELHLMKPDGATIVEIGTLRDNTVGGGHSTYKFGEYCAKFQGKLVTVDISRDAIDFSKKATRRYKDFIEYHLGDSSDFLSTFEGDIDFLYLDGFDSTPGKEKEASIKQLDEIKKAMPRLADSCVVLLDDTKLPEGGKAAYSSGYLAEHGFLLIKDSYQQLYMRGSHSTVRSKLKGAFRRHA